MLIMQPYYHIPQMSFKMMLERLSAYITWNSLHVQLRFGPSLIVCPQLQRCLTADRAAESRDCIDLSCEFAVDSKKLEHGSRMNDAGFPPAGFWGSEDSGVPTFWLRLYSFFVDCTLGLTVPLSFGKPPVFKTASSGSPSIEGPQSGPKRGLRIDGTETAYAMSTSGAIVKHLHGNLVGSGTKKRTATFFVGPCYSGFGQVLPALVIGATPEARGSRRSPWAPSHLRAPVAIVEMSRPPRARPATPWFEEHVGGTLRPDSGLLHGDYSLFFGRSSGAWDMWFVGSF